MASVDLSKYITYHRVQGGPGCWGYATLACWDVLNEIAAPNAPNLSMNLWLRLHALGDLWRASGVVVVPDGRFLSMRKADGTPVPGPEWGDPPFFNTFGNTTEGTEPHVADLRLIGGFTSEGTNEARNYRLAREPTPIAVSTVSFKAELNQKHPIRVETSPGGGQGHVQAILGYDDTTQKFKILDSSGDQAYGADGAYHFLAYADADAQQMPGWGSISAAYTIQIVPPKPVPAAEVWIEHNTTRTNTNLWLSAQGSLQPKRKIWPAQETGEPLPDPSRTLHYKVPLPREIEWPPSPGGRAVLDLYDSNRTALGAGGGRIRAFRAAFGLHVVESAALAGGPIAFGPNDHLQLTIP